MLICMCSPHSGFIFRRAHLKDCFEALKQEVLEGDDEKKASHLAVLKNAVRCIQVKTYLVDLTSINCVHNP